jgi:DNA replication protein DnaC
MLSSLDFIPRGYNICILGASDTGKTYLAKAIGIKACADYRVGYFHCEELLESLVSLKKQDFKKYERKISPGRCRGFFIEEARPTMEL